MVEKGIRAGICHAIHRYVKANNTYILKFYHLPFLPFFPERMKINKCRKLVCNLYDKNNYVVNIRSLKQALNHGLILKKFYRVIKFNQEAWLKNILICILN